MLNFYHPENRCAFIRVIAGTDDETIAAKREYAFGAEKIIAGAERARRYSHKRAGYHVHHVEAWFEIPGEVKRSTLVGSVQNREGNLVYLSYTDHIYVHLAEYLAYGLSWRSGLRQMFQWMYHYHGIEIPDGDVEQVLSDFKIYNTDKSAWPASRVLVNTEESV